MVAARDVAADDQELLAEAVVVEQRRQLAAQRQVGAREDGEADDVHVLVAGGGGDGLRGLLEPSIDDLEAGLGQRPHHHLGAHVMAVEAGLGYQYLGPSFHDRPHPESSLAMISFRISLVPPPIRVKRMSRRWRCTGNSMA